MSTAFRAPHSAFRVPSSAFRIPHSKARRRCDIGNGLILAIPSPLHLIAMKLHALRSPARFENGVDLQDVKYLIKAAKIDTSSKEFTDIVDRYATNAIRRILRELDGEASS
jgi:hypothetical protein